jgi:hypothetical protein
MEKHTVAVKNDKATQSISIIRSLLNDDSFKNERSLLTSGHCFEIF